MENNSDIQKAELDKWADMWDQAQAKGVFDGAETPEAPSSPTGSFFGLQSTRPYTTEAPTDDVDAEYWNKINQYGNSADVPNPLGGSSGGKDELLQEAEFQKDKSKYAPNPGAVDVSGKDQNLEPEPLGVTFDEKDIDELIEIKGKIHDMGSKMAADPMGEGRQFGSQLKSLEKQLDELSSMMGYTYAKLRWGPLDDSKNLKKTN